MSEGIDLLAQYAPALLLSAGYLGQKLVELLSERQKASISLAQEENKFSLEQGKRINELIITSAQAAWTQIHTINRNITSLYGYEAGFPFSGIGPKSVNSSQKAIELAGIKLRDALLPLPISTRDACENTIHHANSLLTELRDRIYSDQETQNESMYEYIDKFEQSLSISLAELSQSVTHLPGSFKEERKAKKNLLHSVIETITTFRQR